MDGNIQSALLVSTNAHLGLDPFVLLIAGVLILMVPRLLTCSVVIHLIVMGLLGLFGGAGGLCGRRHAPRGPSAPSARQHTERGRRDRQTRTLMQTTHTRSASAPRVAAP